MENYDEEIISKILKENLFDYDYYLEMNSDVKNSGVNPLKHYFTYGYKEGRNPSKKFDNNFYKNKYMKNEDESDNPLVHYILYGNENTVINPLSALKSNGKSNKKFLTKEDVEKLTEKDSYYETRWTYYNEIIEIVEKLGNIGNVLELGPYKSPLTENTDVMDITDEYINDYPLNINSFYKHDCSLTPYPIEYKKYDLVIACQVIEHLGIYGQQKNIFNELERISKRAIISLPYKWYAPDMRDHHMIDEKMIDYWANNRKYIFEMVVSSRIIRIYEFD